MTKDAKPHILASDINESAINITLNNAKRAQLDGLITTSIMDIHQLQKPDTSQGGLLLLNPPYGMRMGEQQKTLSLWHDIGQRIREQFAEDETWKTVIVCPDSTHEKALKLKIKRRLQVMHGGKKVSILQAE
jgi:putative N6-adenine-specific DNA methylase